jgi:hypothetical protein
MRLTFLRAALTAASVAGFGASLEAQEPDCAGFRYVEWPERGPGADSGRKLPPMNGAEYGVDINSRIHITADTACLLKLLGQSGGQIAGAGAGALRGRIEALTRMVGAIPKAAEQLEQTFKAYARRGIDPDSVFRPAFISQAHASSRAIMAILGPLQEAIRSRFEASGMASDEAASQASQEIDPVLAGAAVAQKETKIPYDWDAAQSLIDREIRLARADLDKLHGSTAYQLEVRAHLLTGKGQYPVALSGYNDEAQCAETRVDPFEFAVSPAQAALYQQAESLEHQIGTTKSLGDVVFKSVLADFERVRPTFESLWTRASQAAAPVAAAGKALLRWSKGDALDVWITGVGDALSRDAEGKAVKASLDTLAAEITSLNTDLEALRAFASFKDELAGASALTAMQSILGRFDQLRQITKDGAAPLRALQPATWSRRVELTSRSIKQVRALPPGLRDRIRNDPKGPVRDIELLADAVTQVRDSLKGISQEALDLVARLVGLPPALIAKDLPEPAGLRRRALGAGLDTDVQLTRICAKRQENDVVQIEYRFFAGDRPISGWSDRFRLRVFGWRSRVAAGLAFAIRVHTDTWRPGASVSWVFTHSRWPKDASRGLGSSLGLTQFGIGLTAVNLHFESDEAIELGLGPSLSILGDRIIAGIGWNLQAHDDHLYGLISVRLLDLARMQ